MKNQTTAPTAHYFQYLTNGSHNAAQCSTEVLEREYLELNKAGFNDVFGQTARRAQDIVSAELLSRGISQIPNIFGAIQIRKNIR